MDSLIEAMKEKTGTVVSTVPTTSGHIAVIVDAMFMIRIWSFEKGVQFNTISQRNLQRLFQDYPAKTTSLHFCCDHYDEASLKIGTRQHSALHNTGK